MSEVFMYEDILNTLIQLETRGAALYMKLSKQAEDLKAQKLLAFLSEQEDHHRIFYTKLKNEVVSRESVDDEYRHYLEALLDQTYTSLDEAELETNSFKDALKRAKTIEMETLVLLNEFKQLLEQSHHAAIEVLMNEERKHLKLLFDLEKERAFIEDLK